MGSDYIPRNGNTPGPKRSINYPRIPGVPAAPPAIKTPTTVKFLDRVRVKLQRSNVIELQNSAWAKFYAGGTGRVIRFNIEHGTVVVLFDTAEYLDKDTIIMEEFDEYDLERINEAGQAIDIDGNVIIPDPEILLGGPISGEAQTATEPPDIMESETPPELANLSGENAGEDLATPGQAAPPATET